MHRWVWDLRGMPAGGGGRGRGAGGAGRGAAGGAAGGGGGGFGRGRGGSVPHGTYTVRLTVDGQTYTQPLVVHADPRGGF